MTRLIIPVLVALAIVGTAGSGWAADKDGNYTITSPISCGEYLDAYSKSTLTGGKNFSGPHAVWEVVGYIDGFITAYNYAAVNGKANIADGMSNNDVARWIASWCRDNPSRKLHHGILALIIKLEN